MYAYDEARVHFERALELWTSVDRVDLLARAAQAARFAGDPERAVALCREAIELTDEPARKALLYERLGEFHFWDDEAALECYERALALLPGEPRLLAARGARADGPAALGRVARVLRGGARRRAPARGSRSGSCSPTSASRRRARRTCAARWSWPQTGEETARAYLHLGELLRVRGDHAARSRRWSTASARRRGSGCAARSGTSCTSTRADDLLRLGRWDEAAERLAEAAARMDLSRTAVGAAARDRGRLARAAR